MSSLGYARLPSLAAGPGRRPGRASVPFRFKAVAARILETFSWLLTPERRDPLGPAAWQEEILIGDHIYDRASRKSCSLGVLRTEYGRSLCTLQSQIASLEDPSVFWVRVYFLGKFRLVTLRLHTRAADLSRHSRQHFSKQRTLAGGLAERGWVPSIRP